MFLYQDMIMEVSTARKFGREEIIGVTPILFVISNSAQSTKTKVNSLVYNDSATVLLGVVIKVDYECAYVAPFVNVTCVRSGVSVSVCDKNEIFYNLDCCGQLVTPLFETRSVFSKVEPSKSGAQSLKLVPCSRVVPTMTSPKTLCEQLETNIPVVDFMFPIAKGQRMCIMGSKNTQKTTIGLSHLVNDSGVYTVYCGINKPVDSCLEIAPYASEGALSKTVMVSTTQSDPLGCSYICPFVAVNLAIKWMQLGRQVVLVIDDLSSFFDVIQSFGIGSKDKMGQEMMPTNIFSICAKLLEKGVYESTDKGLTILPIVKLEGDSVSGALPTMIMSITDGGIITTSDRFVKPQINLSFSVSRLGGQVQSSLRAKIGRHFKSVTARKDDVDMAIEIGNSDIPMVKNYNDVISMIDIPPFDKNRNSSIDSQYSVKNND